MSKGLDALEKIDHTVCLAFNENNNALFNKDEYEHIDCKDIDEFIKCYETIERELEALEVLKKAFHSSSTYTNKLKDSCECGWITEEEFKLAYEVLHDIDNRVRITPVTNLSVNEIKKMWKV